MPAVPLARALVAEAIGMLALVFAGAAEQPRPAELVGQAVASKEEAA